MRCKPHVSRKKLHKKIEYEKNKNKHLKTAGKMHFSRVNKNSEYQVHPAKIRKTKNCKCKFTECNLLTNEELEVAFKQYYKIRDSDSQKHKRLPKKTCHP